MGEKTACVPSRTSALPLARVEALHHDRGVVDGASRGAGDGEEDRPPSGKDVRPEHRLAGARLGRGQPLRRSAASRYSQQLAGPRRAGLRAQDRVVGSPGALADTVRRVGEPRHGASRGGDLARQPVGVDEADPGAVRGEEGAAAASLRNGSYALAVESAQLDLAVRDVGEQRAVGRESEAGHGQRAGLQTEDEARDPLRGGRLSRGQHQRERCCRDRHGGDPPWNERRPGGPPGIHGDLRALELAERLRDLDPDVREVVQPLAGIAFQTAAQDPARRGRGGGGKPIPLDLGPQHGREHVRGCRPLEQPRAGQHLEQDHAERPDVAATIHGLPPRLLG